MKLSLLELTQRVLESIKGEEVNSITDTAESQAVVNIIKECYYTLVAQVDLPEQKKIFELVPSGDNTKPTLMTIPDPVYGIEWIKYNAALDGETNQNFQTVKPVRLELFLDMMNSYDSDETTVNVMTHDNVEYKYLNDRAPQYFTTLDDTTLLFDSYDADVETTLTAARSQAYGIYLADWDEDDAFVPNLDTQQFVVLLKEAKMMAWQELKQIDNVLAARQSRDIRIATESKKNRANYGNMGYYYDQYPNYGRK